MSRVGLPQHAQSSVLVSGCVWLMSGLEEISPLSLIALVGERERVRRVLTNEVAAAYPPMNAREKVSSQLKCSIGTL